MIEADAPAPDLIARFEHAAEQARQGEDRYRKAAAERIAALALERSTAFRRLNLVRTAINAIAEADDPEKATLRARFILAHMLGWEEPGPRHQIVLDRLMPVLEALDAALKAGGDASGRGTPEECEAALRSFEAWYRAEIGSDFYALFDSYTPETPRVDF